MTRKFNEKQSIIGTYAEALDLAKNLGKPVHLIIHDYGHKRMVVYPNGSYFDFDEKRLNNIQLGKLI